jgi:hypothetical protein
MSIELACLNCACRLRAAPETPHEEIVQLMTEDGPWFALAPGDIFEDMVFAALTRRGRILCPDCGEPVSVHDSSFSELVGEPLAAW